MNETYTPNIPNMTQMPYHILHRHHRPFLFSTANIIFPMHNTIQNKHLLSIKYSAGSFRPSTLSLELLSPRHSDSTQAKAKCTASLQERLWKGSGEATAYKWTEWDTAAAVLVRPHLWHSASYYIYDAHLLYYIDSIWDVGRTPSLLYYFFLSFFSLCCKQCHPHPRR